MRKFFATCAAALAALFWGGCGGLAREPKLEPAWDTRPAYADEASCLEDEPCWDCRTMGNLVCGPVTP